MRRNTTLLLRKFEIGHDLTRPVFHQLTPLLDFKVYPIKLGRPLREMLNNKKFTYSPLKKQFDRIVVLHSKQASNARRSVFINKIRNAIIHLINNRGKQSMMYVIDLMHTSEFVPEKCILQHIQIAMNSKLAGLKLSRNSTGHMEQSIELRDILFPLNMTQWMLILRKSLPDFTKITHHTFPSTFLSMQTLNLYKLQYSINVHYFGHDLQDFDKMLNKFNFIRYFWQIQSQNQFISLKYTQRLIKTIKWRTKESEHYLLIIFRSNNWQRALIIIRDLIMAYEHNHSKLFTPNDCKV